MGPKGNKGEPGVSVTGAKGDKGEPGLPGTIGPGNIYESINANTNVTTQGIKGDKGERVWIQTFFISFPAQIT